MSLLNVVLVLTESVDIQSINFKHVETSIARDPTAVAYIENIKEMYILRWYASEGATLQLS